jgi:hypothetical protein
MSCHQFPRIQEQMDGEDDGKQGLPGTDPKICACNVKWRCKGVNEDYLVVFSINAQLFENHSSTKPREAIMFFTTEDIRMGSFHGLLFILRRSLRHKERSRKLVRSSTQVFNEFATLPIKSVFRRPRETSINFKQLGTAIIIIMDATGDSKVPLAPN